MARIQECREGKTGWATVLVPPTLVTALDRYIAEEAPGLSRPQAMCHALRDWCVEMGYLPVSGMNRDLD
jgi:hypothetical protein